MGRAGQPEADTTLLLERRTPKASKPRSPRRKPVSLLRPEGSVLGRSGWRRLREDLSLAWSLVHEFQKADRKQFEEYYARAIGGVAFKKDATVADVVSRDGIPVSLKTQLDEDPKKSDGDRVAIAFKFSHLGKSIGELRKELRANGQEFGLARDKTPLSDPNEVADRLFALFNKRYDQDITVMKRQLSTTLSYMNIKPLIEGDLRVALLRGKRSEYDWRFRYYEWRIGRRLYADDYDWNWEKGLTLVGRSKKTGERQWSIECNGARLFFHAQLTDENCINDGVFDTLAGEKGHLGLLLADVRSDRLHQIAKAQTPAVINEIKEIQEIARLRITSLLSQVNGEGGCKRGVPPLTVSEIESQANEIAASAYNRIRFVVQEFLGRLERVDELLWGDVLESGNGKKTAVVRRAENALNSFSQELLTKVKEVRQLKRVVERAEKKIRETHLSVLQSVEKAAAKTPGSAAQVTSFSVRQTGKAKTVKDEADRMLKVLFSDDAEDDYVSLMAQIDDDWRQSVRKGKQIRSTSTF